MDHPGVTQTLFFPRRITEGEVPSLPRGGIERIPVGSHTLGAYRYSPLENAPTILFLHGNGEVMTDYLYEFHRWVETLGANFLVVDYRGYGLSTGSPSLSRLLEDARAGWTHAVETLGISPGELIVMGRSLGSLAALEIAGGVGRDARGLILESGIARFDQWVERMAVFLMGAGIDLDAIQSALAAGFDQKRKIKAYPGPILVMHAPFDEIVPVDHGHLLASWGDPAKTRGHIFPAGGHNDIQLTNREEYFMVVGEFMAGLA
jgi:pimeloyl-ACP methyl ester carboxylesterase